MKISVILLAAASALDYEACKLLNQEVIDSDLDHPSVVVSMADCKTTCQAHDQCVAYSFKKADSTCFLKKQKVDSDGETPLPMITQPNEAYDSADVSCNLNPIEHASHVDCRVNDATIKNCKAVDFVRTATDTASCQQICKDTVGCNFFSFDTSGKECSACSSGDLAVLLDHAENHFPLQVSDAVGVISASAMCDLNKLNIADVLRGEDGIEHHVAAEGTVEGQHEVLQIHDPDQAIEDHHYTLDVITDRVYQTSDSPTTSPTLSPTTWDVNPENYWVPCQASDFGEWQACSQSCGEGGVQESQSTFTPAHMNSNYRGAIEGIPDAPACQICTQYDTEYPYSCTSYDLIEANAQAVVEPDYATQAGEVPTTSYYVTKFQDCGNDPCPIDCEWSSFGDWFSSGTEGELRRTRSVKIAAEYGGTACNGESFESKHWQNTVGEIAGTKDFCVAGTSNGEWSPCVLNANGKTYSSRVKVETICNDGFYKLSQADIDAAKACREDGKIVSASALTEDNSIQCDTIFECRAFAQEQGADKFSFSKTGFRLNSEGNYVVALAGDADFKNCVLAGDASTEEEFIQAETSTVACNLNAAAARAGSNPAKVHMRFKQTKECADGSPVGDYTRTMRRAERPGLTSAPVAP